MKRSKKNAATDQRNLSQADSVLLTGQISQMGNATHSFERKQFHYIHIPKTAGESFLLDSPFHLEVGSTMQGNQEKSYYGTPQLFLDDPTRYSCKYDPYFRSRTINLPGYSLLENATDGFDEWVSHFIEIGSTNNEYGKDVCYRCYEPWNMQARYLTASGKSDPHFASENSGRVPSIDLAETNLRKVDVVGITEYYSASLCLLEFFALDGDLSPLCRQCDPISGHIVAQERQHRESHGVPHHSVDMISEQSLQYIESNLTTVDQQLYEIGLQLFAEQVEQVWRATGVDLLCGDHFYEQPKQVVIPTNESPSSWNMNMHNPANLLYLIPFMVVGIVFYFAKLGGVVFLAPDNVDHEILFSLPHIPQLFFTCK